MSRHRYHAEEIHCSFCGRASSEVTSMIAGSDVYICDICIQNSVEILRRNVDHFSKHQQQSQPETLRFKLLKPSELKQALDQHIIGQDHAKEMLSVAVYNHYKRIQSQDLMGTFDDVEIEKSNVLLLGPTGTGKTLLAQTLARVLDVPLVIADATTLTEAGYVGDDVESVLSNLLQNANFDLQRTERGIVYIDEIDKICRKSDSASITRDVSGEGVQQALLKMLEGTVAGVPPRGGRKHPEQPLVQINTKNILFICGGAFEGLDKIIARRLKNTTIGFSAEQTARHVEESTELLKHVANEDLLRYGFIPEFIGRLPIISALHPLSDEAMMDILTRPKNALVKQYQKLFLMDGIELEFREDALQAIVERAKARKTGARALRSIMEEVMIPVMYRIPDLKNVRKCVITRAVIEHKAEPELLYVLDEQMRKAS